MKENNHTDKEKKRPYIVDKLPPNIRLAKMFKRDIVDKLPLNIRLAKMFKREFDKACSEQLSLSELICNCLINAYSMGNHDEFERNIKEQMKHD